MIKRAKLGPMNAPTLALAFANRNGIQLALTQQLSAIDPAHKRVLERFAGDQNVVGGVDVLGSQGDCAILGKMA